MPSAVAAGPGTSPRRWGQLAVRTSPDDGDDCPSESAGAILLAVVHEPEIASRLFVSVRTVESHRAHILVKLRLSTAPTSSTTPGTGLLRPETELDRLPSPGRQHRTR
jgi:hypothetical protein